MGKRPHPSQAALGQGVRSTVGVPVRWCFSRPELTNQQGTWRPLMRWHWAGMCKRDQQGHFRRARSARAQPATSVPHNQITAYLCLKLYLGLQQQHNRSGSGGGSSTSERCFPRHQRGVFLSMAMTARTLVSAGDTWSGAAVERRIAARVTRVAASMVVLESQFW